MTVLDTAFGTWNWPELMLPKNAGKSLEILFHIRNELENYAHSFPDELSGGDAFSVGCRRALTDNRDIFVWTKAFSTRH